ncbi:MAG: hypothetical protein WKF43_01300 [Acidimicrobiales bacterium]
MGGSAHDAEHRQPNYSVVLPGLDEPDGRELNLLLRGDVVVVRSRSVRRVIDALLGYLTADVAEEPGLWRISAFPVVRQGRAALLPDELRSALGRVQPRLSRAGLSMVDLPAALVDASTVELVVPPLGVAHDAELVRNLGPVRAAGTELPPTGPGRYPLAAWLFPDPGPETSVAATSLALAVAAVDAPKDPALLDRVEAFLHRLAVAAGADLDTVITGAAEHLPPG